MAKANSTPEGVSTRIIGVISPSGSPLHLKYMRAARLRARKYFALGFLIGLPAGWTICLAVHAGGQS